MKLIMTSRAAPIASGTAPGSAGSLATEVSAKMVVRSPATSAMGLMMRVLMALVVLVSMVVLVVLKWSADFNAGKGSGKVTGPNRVHQNKQPAGTPHAARRSR